ncbi:TNT domain-containing protein [Amycolatopsis rhabdoformis]|uniref:TNT domain-containing protein n=1 Tax=Amycolatopsis rhabdoformis TaxID=1448059 RepID=A0ABZ1I5A9_9PSEU|nr:TNT domain-containing protein [Amycolatopsis rhabdoformis]WSE29394.1 TNT domain-containing protein [Amycolatopsis rhabdoformis]
MRDAGYRRYRVVKPVPMWRSTAAAWAGRPGGGTRYRAVLAADELVTLGFLADVTRETR